MNRLKHKNLYFVGGVVRDEIIGVPSFDTDFCYEGNAINFAESSNFEIIKRNLDFGTVRVNLNNKEIDIASTREEVYPKPGHLPIVSNIGCSLQADLKRRDFTINAMAKNTITGKIYDPFNGQSDIENKLIRVLHHRSFIDDPTRILRALKFSVRFGFDLEKETKELQNQYLSNINYDMSYHRLKKELMETFNLNKAEAFDKFVEGGIYKLLGEEQTKPNVSGTQIKKVIEKSETKEKTLNIWIIYAGFFSLSLLPLTKREQNVLTWAERLKQEKPSNNTPEESLLIHKIYTENNTL